MEERRVECDDGTRWKAIVATRSSPHRLELVFESLDKPGLMLRAEAAVTDLQELTDEELCFLLRQAR